MLYYGTAKQAKNGFCEDKTINMADGVHLLMISQSVTLTYMMNVLPYLDGSWRGYKL